MCNIEILILTIFSPKSTSSRRQMGIEATGLSKVQKCSSAYSLPLSNVYQFVLSISILLALTQSLDNMFNSCIVLCENDYFWFYCLLQV